MSFDPRFKAEAGLEIYSGNELLVKGALETDGGVHLLTGYPGSPVAGFFDVCSDIADMLKQHGVRAYQANNEALGVAALNGSQMMPVRAIAAMKSVGVHVAADALALGNLAGAHPQGGVIVISGEDPWCDSTQVPADSRFLFQHLRMPVVEPGGPQQLKDWIDASFKLSQAAGLYIGYIVTTAQADAGGTVQVKPNQWPGLNTNQPVDLDTRQIDLNKVLLPPRTWQQELRVPERFAATLQAARRLGVNRIIPSNFYSQTGSPAPLGFIVTGMAGPFLAQMLAEVGLAGVFPILQMGMSYPVDVELVADFARLCRTMIVIEERRSFLEMNIRDTLFRTLSHEQAAALSARLFGKSFPAATRPSATAAASNSGLSTQDAAATNRPGIPETRGLDPSLLATILIPLLQETEELPADLRNGRLTAELELLRKVSRPKLQVLSAPEEIIGRSPTFCPGCPHRDSSSVLLEVRKNLQDKDYMQRTHGTGPVDLVAHGDTGCYTMLMFPPTEQLMHNYSGMGLGAGTGSGIDPFITNKQIVFMGDGTFFHSGQLAISNAIKAGQDITFIILENKTTAMTGHQDHAGQDTDAFGNVHAAQEIEQVVRGITAGSGAAVVRISPAQRDRYRSILEKTILAPGVKIIIADKECGITAQRKVLRQERAIIRKNGFLPEKTYMNITPEVCEGCLECTKQTACPGLTTVETDYGRKIDTDLTWCVNDGACERVRATNDIAVDIKPCPSFEQVIIKRKKAKESSLPNLRLDKLPDPQHRAAMNRSGATWRMHVTGVGGMGIGVVSAILVRAGHRQGYRVAFADKKGLAIRNGGVYSQIAYIAPEPGADEAGAAPSELAMTGQIPYGRANLLLGLDVLEATRAIDPRERFRVASAEHTSCVINLYKQPTVSHLIGKSDFDPDRLCDEIFSHCRPDGCYSRDLSKLCEQRLGSKQYVNLMMLGVAFQLGLIPVSLHSIAWAIRDSIPREHTKNLEAFQIGRRLALEPQALYTRPVPDTWEYLLERKARILQGTRWRGATWAERFEQLAQRAIKEMPNLPANLKYDLVLRIYDTLQFQDHRYAAHYVEKVQAIYQRDSAARNYAATRAVIWNLAKVMLIKDEVYVSYLLTRHEKRQRDIAKYDVDIAGGDQILYRHHTKPEFGIGKWRFRLSITTRDWQLRLVSRMKWLRRLPGWHRREVEFREWYTALLTRVSLTDADYATAVQILSLPEEVSGYREIRYPKQDAARQKAEGLLRGEAQPGTGGGSAPRVELTVLPSTLRTSRVVTEAVQ